MLRYDDIISIRITKAHLTRGWLGLILLGVIADAVLFYLLYLFLIHFYSMSDLHGGHYQSGRRSPGIIIGILVVLPVIIFIRIKRYFPTYPMLIIRWDHGEFRVRLSELKITAGEVKQYLESKGQPVEMEV